MSKTIHAFYWSSLLSAEQKAGNLQTIFERMPSLERSYFTFAIGQANKYKLGKSTC